MSHENVEIVRRGFDCFVDGDLDGWLELVHPEIRWDISAHPLPDVPDRGHGRDAWAREFLGTYLSGWIDYSVQVKRSLQSERPMSSLFFTKRPPCAGVGFPWIVI